MLRGEELINYHANNMILNVIHTALLTLIISFIIGAFCVEHNYDKAMLVATGVFMVSLVVLIGCLYALIWV